MSVEEQTLSDHPDIDADRREYWTQRGLAPPITVGQFLREKYEVEFLVERCLVKDSSCIIAGASKSLKTTVSLHLGLALATGCDFLGQFSCTQTPVMFASAESGEATLQRNLRGMADLMDVDLDELAAGDQMSMQFWVPRISDDDLMDYFADCIDQTGAKAVVLDPLYLAMDGETQASLSLNGEQIQKLVRLILDKGATPIIDDHVKRSSGNAKEYKPIALEDVSGAGKAENFRQWMLLGRRSQYENDDGFEKHHDLWLTAGGSAGHSATWGLDVTETFSHDYADVQYSMTLRRGSEVKEELKTASVDKRAERAARKEEAARKTREAKCEKVACAMNREPDKLFTRTEIRAIAQVSSDKANEIIYELESTNRVAKHPEGVKRGNNRCEAWQVNGTALMDLAGGEDSSVGQPFVF